MRSTSQLVFRIRRDGHLGQIMVHGFVPSSVTIYGVPVAYKIVRQVLVKAHWVNVEYDVPPEIRKIIKLSIELPNNRAEARKYGWRYGNPMVERHDRDAHMFIGGTRLFIPRSCPWQCLDNVLDRYLQDAADLRDYRLRLRK